ncbi:MAG: TMEM175 family protein [Candidatus Cybelea sp.]
MIRAPRFSTEAGRLEAFSDGVIAVIITIMVLELRPPDGTGLGALHALIPTFSAYVLSFVFIGIYWNNHHHLLRASDGIDGRVMWANLHLLFWLSLVPFTTAWLGRNAFAPVPTALYGFVLLMDAIAFSILQAALLNVDGCGGVFAKAVNADFKGKISPALYLCAIAISFFSTIAADALFVAVAVLWIVPDRRFESVIAERSGLKKNGDAEGGRTPE